MHNEINLSQNPQVTAKKLVTCAYQVRSKQQRTALRVMQRVLKLAQERGFADKDEFVEFYSMEEDKQKPAQSRRLLSKLFEFVSADEIVQLAQTIR